MSSCICRRQLIFDELQIQSICWIDVYSDLVLQLLLELVSPGALYTCGRLELHCVDQATIEGSSSTVLQHELSSPPL